MLDDAESMDGVKRVVYERLSGVWAVGIKDMDLK